MKILVLGVSGMLGSTVFKELNKIFGPEVYGTVREPNASKYHLKNLENRVRCNILVENIDSIIAVLDELEPKIIINCIGIINKYEKSRDPLVAIPVNSIFPHLLAKICKARNIKLIQPSTDCVFSGKKGGYTEDDVSDAKDLYGKSKSLGEISDHENVLTLRTSLIGHEILTKNELLEWFLSQTTEVKGYTNAIFSGLTTLQFSRVISATISDNASLYGIYNVSSAPISKFELLKLIARVYKKNIIIIPDGELKIDRSLDSSLFSSETGYKRMNWEDQINDLYENNKYG